MNYAHDQSLAMKSKSITKQISGDHTGFRPTKRDLYALADYLDTVNEKRKAEGVASKPLDEERKNGDRGMYG